MEEMGVASGSGTVERGKVKRKRKRMTNEEKDEEGNKVVTAGLEEDPKEEEEEDLTRPRNDVVPVKPSRKRQKQDPTQPQPEPQLHASSSSSSSSFLKVQPAKEADSTLPSPARSATEGRGKKKALVSDDCDDMFGEDEDVLVIIEVP